MASFHDVAAATSKITKYALQSSLLFNLQLHQLEFIFSFARRFQISRKIFETKITINKINRIDYQRMS